MRGDRVEIVVAADDGARTYELVATRAGRRVEITSGRGVVEVAEVTRSGEPVRRARFMASRVMRRPSCGAIRHTLATSSSRDGPRRQRYFLTALPTSSMA